VLDLGGGQRTVAADLVEHPGDQLGLLDGDPAHPAPGVGVRAGHPPAQRRLEVDREQGSLVAPVFEEVAGPPVRRPVEQVGRIGPESAVQREVVGPLQHVDRIHLEQADPVEHPTQVTTGRHAARRRVGEPLGGQRDPPGLGQGQ
jgi:hypothetical protein